MFRLYTRTNTSLSTVSKAGFASKAMAGYSHNNKPGPGKRLGLKKSGGQEVRARDILARQRGFKWRLGENVYAGRDQTIHASKQGIVAFSKDPFTTGRKRVSIHVIEQEIPNRYIKPPPPFMFHPELQPEYAALNPEPQNHILPIKKRTPKEKKEKYSTPKPIKIENEDFGEKIQGDIQILACKIQQQKKVDLRFKKSLEMVESLKEKLQTHDFL